MDQDTFNSLDRPDDVIVPAQTYTTTVRPHQLKRGDTVRVPYGPQKVNDRTFTVDSVVYGELIYRGGPVQVLFVTGYELQRLVKYTKTPWEYITVTRRGEAPPYFLRALSTAADPFVY